MRRAWRIVELAGHPAVGVCLDSFHILSRGHDPAEIEQIPGDRIFFVQLPDAPMLSLDVLSWSRHHRLFPGEGGFDLAGFVGHVLRAGYTGPLSLEVFQRHVPTDESGADSRAGAPVAALAGRPGRSSGRRSRPGCRLDAPRYRSADGVDFVEIAAADSAAVEQLLEAAGFAVRGRHRTKPVTLWTAGRARVVLNAQHPRGAAPHVAALGFEVDEPDAVTRRVDALRTPRAYRRTYTSEERLEAAVVPDHTDLFWALAADTGEPAWGAEFGDGGAEAAAPGGGVVGIDHVSLTQPWQVVDESVLFYTATFALVPQGETQVAGPRGLVDSRVIASPDRGIRLPLNVAPAAGEFATSAGGLPQHIAFGCRDVAALAASARGRGLELLEIPDNYYDDLAARTRLTDAELQTLRGLGILYDEDATGQYLQFYTRTLGQVFFEFVERRGRYDGYGAGNAGIRLTAQSA